MTPLPTTSTSPTDCWNQIGVWGDGTCPELRAAVHCHNCPIFAAAGRRFLDAASPPGYSEEWAERLAAPQDETKGDVETILVFRIREEWLALPVRVLVEVIAVRTVMRVPHRAGLLAGLVNIRGELQLCVRMDQLLGINSPTKEVSSAPRSTPRLLVIRRDGEEWVFPVDEVDQVRRFPTRELGRAPATLERAAAKMTRGVFTAPGRSIGYLNDAVLFQSLRTKLR